MTTSWHLLMLLKSINFSRTGNKFESRMPWDRHILQLSHQPSSCRVSHVLQYPSSSRHLFKFRWNTGERCDFYLILPHSTSFYLILPHSTSFYLILSLLELLRECWSLRSPQQELPWRGQEKEFWSFKPWMPPRFFATDNKKLSSKIVHPSWHSSSCLLFSLIRPFIPSFIEASPRRQRGMKRSFTNASKKQWASKFNFKS